MKPIIFLQLGISVFFTIVASLFIGKEPAVSFFLGAALATINLVSFALITRRIFAKKSVATTLLIIIFKYSILGLGLYVVVTYKAADLVWLVIGLSTLIPSALGHVFLFSREEKDVAVEGDKK